MGLQKAQPCDVRQGLIFLQEDNTTNPARIKQGAIDSDMPTATQ